MTKEEEITKSLNEWAEGFIKQGGNQLKEEDFPETKPCLHDKCSECHGSGRKKDGSFCVHHLSCPCPRCSPLKFK